MDFRHDHGIAIKRARNRFGGRRICKTNPAWPSPRRLGVPTAMNTASAAASDTVRSVVNASRPAFMLFSTSCSRPGSNIGIPPAFSLAILSASLVDAGYVDAEL